MDSATPKDFQLKMPQPPRLPGSLPPLGSNIQLVPPLQFPSKDLNTQNQDSNASAPAQNINLNLPQSPIPPPSPVIGQQLPPLAYTPLPPGKPSKPGGLPDLKLEAKNVGPFSSLSLTLPATGTVVAKNIRLNNLPPLKVSLTASLNLNLSSSTPASSTSSSAATPASPSTPPPGWSAGIEFQTVRKVMASGTPGEIQAAYNKSRDASNAMSNPLPPNPSIIDRAGPVLNAASSIVNYGNATKWEDKPYSSFRVGVGYNPAQVTPDAVRSNGISNNELTPGWPGLGNWSVSASWTLHF